MKLRATFKALSLILLSAINLVLFAFYQSALMQMYLYGFWLC